MTKKHKEKPSLNLHFPSDSKVQPKGFADANVGEKVSVVITGTVTRIEHAAETWDPGKRFGMTIEGCVINTESKKTSLKTALKKTQLRVA